jgi:hypothetical protein
MIRLMAFLFLACILVGCASSASGPSAAEMGKEPILHEVGGLIRVYSGENGRGPKQPADLAKYENGYPLGYAAVRSGEVVVVWGAKVAGEGDAGSAPPDVVAYEKKTPTDGGWVLLQNGTVKEMTASEFKSAPKAK